MCLVQTETIVARITKSMPITNEEALRAINEERRLEKESANIYATDSELTHHCMDMVDMLVPTRTSKEQKDIYVAKALEVAKQMSCSARKDIGILNRRIQQIVME